MGSDSSQKCSDTVQCSLFSISLDSSQECSARVQHGFRQFSDMFSHGSAMAQAVLRNVQTLFSHASAWVQNFRQFSDMFRMSNGCCSDRVQLSSDQNLNVLGY